MYRKDRQNEHYTELAHKENYPARSVYKLKEIDQKYRIIKNGDNVLDLGCAPGSWLLYASQKTGPKGHVTGVDLAELNIELKNNITFLKKDIFELKDEDLKTPFDCVISDMAPSTTGVVFVDSGKSLELCEIAFDLAQKFLRPGGNFVCKIFDSHEANLFFKEIQKHFGLSKRFKPRAVMKNSKEFYIIGAGFKPD